MGGAVGLSEHMCALIDHGLAVKCNCMFSRECLRGIMRNVLFWPPRFGDCWHMAACRGQRGASVVCLPSIDKGVLFDMRMYLLYKCKTGEHGGKKTFQIGDVEFVLCADCLRVSDLARKSLYSLF